MADSSGSNDRRSDARIEVAFPINVLVEETGQRTPALVENVSLSGALLRTEAALPLEARIVLEIVSEQLPGLTIPATVVRFTGAQSYGAAFVRLSDKDAADLMELAAEYLKASSPGPWFIG